MRKDIIKRSAVDGTLATKAYEDRKISHLNTEALCQEEGVTFIPMVCEAQGGGWGPMAHKVWSELAKYKSLISGELNSIIVNQMLQSLSLILHRENARSILRRSPKYLGRNDNEILSASVFADNSCAS